MVATESSFGELVINEIMDHRCSVQLSQPDLAFLPRQGKALLLGLLEFKRTTPKHTNSIECQNDLRQTICYMLTPLAYTLWGKLGKSDDLVSLLVYPRLLIRITISKPKDSSPCFGLTLSIDQTRDPEGMRNVIKQYLSECSHLCNAVIENQVTELQEVFPWKWTPMNISKGFELIDRKPSFGFVFRIDSDNFLSHLPSDEADKYHALIPSKTKLIVKYLSALLTIQYAQSAQTVRHLIEYQERLEARQELLETEKRLQQLRHAAGKRLQQERQEAEKRQKQERQERLEQLQELRQAADKLAEELRKHHPTFEFPSLGFIDHANHSSNTSTNLPLRHNHGSNADGEADNGCLHTTHGDTSGACVSELVEVSEKLNLDQLVKHPYIGVTDLDCFNPLLVMYDMGSTLSELICDGSVLSTWQSNRSLRTAFLNDIGHSALNLVVHLRLYHPDIRLSNITFKDGSFCLIDYDFCSPSCTFEVQKCAITNNFGLGVSALFAWTTAQILLIIFVLGAKIDDKESCLNLLRNIHLLSQKPKESPQDHIFKEAFSTWISAEGVLKEFFVPSESQTQIEEKRKKIFYIKTLEISLDLEKCEVLCA